METGFNTFVIRAMWTVCAFVLPWLVYLGAVSFAEARLRRRREAAKNMGYLAGGVAFVLFLFLTGDIHGGFEQ